MGEQTGISWCHATLNFWVGCTKVSNGPAGACEHCYAETWAKRWPQYRDTWGTGATRVRFKDTRAKALKLERLANIAAYRREPFYCFSNSLSDMMDKEVPIAWLAEAFDDMRAAPHVTFLVLTKRAPLIQKRVEAAGGLPPNVALGITVVAQQEADRDVPHLLRAKAALKPAFVFLSMEPLMGPVDLTWLPHEGDVEDDGPDGVWDVLRGRAWIAGDERWDGAPVPNWRYANGSASPRKYLPGQHFSSPTIDWVITGGESGNKARPTHPDWMRSIRDQCAAAGVPYHHKQNGEWAAEGPHNREMVIGPGAGISHPTFELARIQNPGSDGRLIMAKISKKASGRLLDGVLHDAMPEVR